jgi:hypothetical protein
MRHRVIFVLGAAAVALGAPLLAAAPASASNGPPVVGCTTGSSCMIELNYDVTYSGSTGGSNGVVITPPPCTGFPAGDAHSGSQAIISFPGNTAPLPPPGNSSPASSPAAAGSGAPAGSTSPSSPASTASPPAPALSGQEQAILSQAEQLVNSNPMTPGEWHQITGNPYASSAAQQKCNNLPPYIWVPGGQSLVVKGLNIPARTLAELAYSQLTTAQVGTVTLNPKGMSDTNLPTFVDAVLKEPAGGVLAVTGGENPNVPAGRPYVWATAATPDGKSATVWAWATGFTIDPGTSDAKTRDQPSCSMAHPAGPDGHGLALGSRLTASAGSYGAG